MFEISRMRVISLGLLSAVSFPSVYSVSAAFADAGHHSAPVRQHSQISGGGNTIPRVSLIATKVVSPVASSVKITRPKVPFFVSILRPFVSALRSEKIKSSTTGISTPVTGPAGFNRTLYNIQFASCPIGTNSHGGCVGAGVAHQAADAALGYLTGKGT